MTVGVARVLPSASEWEMVGSVSPGAVVCREGSPFLPSRRPARLVPPGTSRPTVPLLALPNYRFLNLSLLGQGAQRAY